MHQIGAFFLTRAKKNLRARRVCSARKDPERGIVADQTIALDGPVSQRRYPAHLRRIRYRDPNSGKTLVFLTNRADLDARTICNLYKNRWQVELFFRWIKQHLRIKQFFGTSENAVKSQLWVAVSVYVLVATIRKQLGIETPSTPCSRSCRCYRLNKSHSMKCLQDLNPGLPTGRCRINCLCSPLDQTPPAVEINPGTSIIIDPSTVQPTRQSKPYRTRLANCQLGCCSRGGVLSQWLSKHDQRSRRNGCL